MFTWIKRLFEKSSDPMFHRIVREDGSVALVDQQTKDYLESTLPDPAQADLDQLFQGAREIQVVGKYWSDRQPTASEKRLVQLVETEEQATLIQHFRLAEQEEFLHLMSVGSLVIRIHTQAADWEELEYLGDGYVRWEKRWKGDGLLEDTMAFLHWLNEHGVAGPLQDHLEREASLLADEQRFEAWAKAAHPAIKPWLNADPWGDPNFDLTTLWEQAKNQAEDETALIRNILKLYGQGNPDWGGGISAFESILSDALDLVALPTVIKAVQAGTLSEDQREGLARYLVSAGKQKSFQKYVDPVPPALIETLRAHVNSRNDDEKSGHFEHFQRLL